MDAPALLDRLLPEYLRPKGRNVPAAEVARRRRRNKAARAARKTTRGT